MKKLKIAFILILLIIVHVGFSQNSKFIIDSIYSQHLLETRTVCLYLPPNFDTKEVIPVIFTTDGQLIANGNYKQILDSLIINNIICPVVLIGVYSNDNKILEDNIISYRQYEYIKGFAKDNKEAEKRFENHFTFFTQEVEEFVTAKYFINPDTSKNTFYGTSNGGGFGISLFFLCRNQYQNYLCFSPLGYETKRIIRNAGNNKERLFIAYGNNETPLLESYEKLLKILNKSGYTYNIHVFNGGHEQRFWKEYFKAIIIELYKIE